jgi:hypothetical protein
MTWADLVRGVTFLIVAFGAWTLLRNAVGNLTDEIVPEEARRLEDYYVGRGFKVVAIARASTRALLRYSIRREGPIRTYLVTLERPDGVRETRLRGVARGARERLTLWRFNPDGSPEQMH